MESRPHSWLGLPVPSAINGLTDQDKCYGPRKGEMTLQKANNQELQAKNTFGAHTTCSSNSCVDSMVASA